MPRNFLAQLAARVVPFAPCRDVRKIERRAAAIQRLQLKSLLEQAANTECGRAHGYPELTSLRDPTAQFQRRVPVQRYADFEASIERMRRGERDVLWPGKCRCFGLSGGTYSTGKVVPAHTE